MVSREQQRLFDHEPTVIWHTKNECTLWQYRVPAIASIYFPDFFFLHLPCLIQSRVGQILSPPTNCLIRYLIRPINFPNSVKKKNMHYRMTEFCENIYINTKFFNIFNPFPMHPFLQQWSATGSIEKFKIRWSWRLVFITFDRY